MTNPDPVPWEAESRGDEPLSVSGRDRRTTWIATLVILVALAAAGVFFALQVWWAVAVGAAVALAGAVVAWRAGVLDTVRR